MVLEDELRAALKVQAELLLDAASTCIRMALWPPSGLSEWLFGANEAQSQLRRAEALETAILTRCGVSWDSLAARRDQSRQALHRRLAKTANEQWNLALEYEALTGSDISKRIRGFSVGEAINRLRDPDGFYANEARELSDLRRVPHWWRREDLL
jgi:hypothetical protein